jgi:hypothetical protein
MTTTEAQHRINCGWHVVDDDLPNVPNCDPLASAQARRYWRQSSPADTAQGEVHGRHIPHQRT